MSKYLPLGTYLRRQKVETVILTFAEIERIVGRILPKASADPAWWHADAAPFQPQQRVLVEAGFTAEANLRAETVRFSRSVTREDKTRASSQTIVDRTGLTAVMK